MTPACLPACRPWQHPTSAHYQVLMNITIAGVTGKVTGSLGVPGPELLWCSEPLTKGGLDAPLVPPAFALNLESTARAHQLRPPLDGYTLNAPVVRNNPVPPRVSRQRQRQRGVAPVRNMPPLSTEQHRGSQWTGDRQGGSIKGPDKWLWRYDKAQRLAATRGDRRAKRNHSLLISQA